MSLEYYYRDTDGTLVGPVTLLSNYRVRLFTLEVTQNAEEGTAANSRIPVEDPLGDLVIPGLRFFAIKENAISNSSNTFIAAGYTTDRRVSRGENFRVEAARLWDVGFVDPNTILDRRVMVGSDCNRPAESDVARVTWLMSTAEASLITDLRYLSTANPEPMDAVDYTGQMFKGILDDCAQQSGKNYYVTFFGDTATANQPWGAFSLWYGDAGSTDYTSTISLSNDLADVDGLTTFAISQENTVLTRDPSRVVSGAYLPYDGGSAYTQNLTTVTNFARRDMVFPAENVKTAAKANRRGQRYLADLDEEEDVIATEFIVPRAQVNDLREGMRIPFKATHLPGYEVPHWVRCLNRTVVDHSEQYYRLKVELSGQDQEVALEQNLLVAFINKGGPGDLSEPSDLSTHAWTKAFWTGNYATPTQFPGPGGPGSFGIWYRQAVVGESATVLQISSSPSQSQSVWVYQVRGASSTGVTVSSGIDILPFSAGGAATITSPVGAVGSVFLGGYMLQKVNYGQCTTVDTTQGAALANVNGNNDVCPCGSGDPNPPKVWIGYRSGIGALTIGGTLNCDGAGPGDYNHYGRGYGGLLLPLSTTFSVTQQAFATNVAANVVVTLPSPP